MSRTRPIALAALTLIAFTLRVARLDFQSLWKDEVAGVVNSLASLPAITFWAAASEPHPPLHYYILHVWMLAVGSSELAVRFPSVVFGTASIPAAYMLLRQLTSPTRALLGATALAMSPFHVFYSQEARMHVEACFFLIIATWALLVSLRRPRVWTWIGYGAAAVAALYTFYYTALPLIALNLSVLARRNARSRAWWLANAAAVATTMPWLLLVSRTTRRFLAEPLPVAQALNFADLPRAVLVYAFGPSANVPLSGASAAALTIALLVCACRLIRARQITDEQLMLWAFLPPVAIYFSTLVAVGSADSAPRLVLICLPAWIAIIVRGWPARWRLPAPAWVLIALGLALPTFESLAANYGNPNGRDNYRAAFQLLRQEGMPDEALIYDVTEQAPALTYYYQDSNLPAFGLPNSNSRERTEAQLVQLASRYHGFWALLYGEPRPWVEDWLKANLVMLSDQWLGPYARLEHFVAAPYSTNLGLPDGIRVDASFGPFELRQLGLPRQSSETSVAFEALWALKTPTDADYIRSFQLFDSSGNRVAQSDAQPLQGALPTSRWQPGKDYEEPVVLRPTAPLPTGTYTLKATLYASGAPSFNQATVLRFVHDPHAKTFTLSAQSDSGWTIAQAAVSTGQTGDLLLQVQGTVQNAPHARYTWFAHLMNASGAVITQDDHPPIAATDTWRPGDRINEVFDLGPGREQASEIEIGAYDPSGLRAQLTLGGRENVDHVSVPLP